MATNEDGHPACDKCGESMIDYKALHDPDDNGDVPDIPTHAACLHCGHVHLINES